jgi:hypothetical protein
MSTCKPSNASIEIGIMPMSGRTPGRKGRLTALCMLVAAIIMIGLVLTGELHMIEPRAPIALAAN